MATQIVDFIADGTGDIIEFVCESVGVTLSVDNVSIKEIEQESTSERKAVKEFLTGSTDDGKPIFFRADTQQLLLNASFEKFASPMAIVTRSKRGSMVKCYVALDDDLDFYEVQGTVEKGVSILKVGSRDKANMTSPPLAREIKVSWRDSSKQLCRLNQAAIRFVQNSIEKSQ